MIFITVSRHSTRANARRLRSRAYGRAEGLETVINKIYGYSLKKRETVPFTLGAHVLAWGKGGTPVPPLALR